MSDDILQINYDSMADIASRFFQQADAVDQMLQTLRLHTDSLQGDWLGVASDQFFNEMEAEIFPPLTRLVQALTDGGELSFQIIEKLSLAEEEAAGQFTFGDVDHVAEQSQATPLGFNEQGTGTGSDKPSPVHPDIEGGLVPPPTDQPFPDKSLPESYVDIDIPLGANRYGNNKGAIIAENAILSHNHYDGTEQSITITDIHGNTKTLTSDQFVIYTGPMLGDMQGAVSVIIFTEPVFDSSQVAPIGELSEESVGTTVYQSVMEGGVDGLYEAEITSVDQSSTNIHDESYDAAVVNPDNTVSGDSGGPIYSDNGDVVGVNNSGDGTSGYVSNAETIQDVIDVFTYEFEHGNGN